MSDDPAGESSTRTRSEKYFFSDELVIFLVEDTLYRVHQHFLVRGSEVFRGMFACPPGDGARDGQSEDAPIELPGVKVKEMDALLDFFYDRTEPHQLPGITAIHLLSISTRYVFEEAQEAAQKQVAAFAQKIHPVRRICLAREHPHISDWLRPAFLELCVAKEPLTIEEAGKIGVEMATQIAYVREKSRVQCMTQYAYGRGPDRESIQKSAEALMKDLPPIV